MSKVKDSWLISLKNEQIDEKKNEVIIKGKPYNLIDLWSDLIVNHKGLESVDSHLYDCLKLSNFPKSLIANKHVLKRLREFGEISQDISIDSTQSGHDD